MYMCVCAYVCLSVCLNTLTQKMIHLLYYMNSTDRAPFTTVRTFRTCYSDFKHGRNLLIGMYVCMYVCMYVYVCMYDHLTMMYKNMNIIT